MNSTGRRSNAAKRWCMVTACVLCAIAGSAASLAPAADYPTKPIRFVVGPGPDVLARLVGQKLTDAWSEQVVVDQRPGAGGIIAADTVAKSAPDGYTLLLTTGSYTINATLYHKLPYDLVRDFEPVSLLVSIPFLLVVNPAVPAKSVNELLQLARARPGQLNCASSGNGTTAHLGCEMLKNLGKIDIVHVPYKGIAPAITDLLGGQVQMMFAVAQAGLPNVKAGKLRALAVSGARRSAAAPDLPTVAEAGIPGFAFDSWNGVHVPAHTPKAVIAKLHNGLVSALKAGDMPERLLTFGLEPVGSTPDAFGKFVKEDVARWAKVIRASNVRVE